MGTSQSLKGHDKQAEARRTREEVLQKEKGGWDYLPDSESLRSSNEQDALRNFQVLSEAKAQVHIAKKQCLS